jgi:integral membrane protein (TIGR01906 family)
MLTSMPSRLLTTFVVWTTPLLLVLFWALGLVIASPLFLQLEYTRPSFPPDAYGFSTQDRLTYAPLGITYLLSTYDINWLAEKTLVGELCYPPQANPCSLFNEGELKHMQDVKNVTWFAFVGFCGLLALHILTFAFFWRGKTIQKWYVSLMRGSLLTICVIIGIIILAVTAWDLFFDAFHGLFFAEGTWRFYYSDTLIRLYPEQFWLDASLVIGFLVTISAFAIAIIARRVTLKAL